MEKLDSGKAIFSSVVYAVIAVGLAYVAWHLTQNGLSGLKELRQLERVPQLDVIGAIPGEAILSGNIVESKTVTSPKGGVKSVYYRYLVEKRCKDSDGDMKWCTQTNREEHVPFKLSDSTGDIEVVPTYNIDWQAPKRLETTIGDYRYTEWRLQPGDYIHAFGYVQGQQLRFDTEGLYQPIITTSSIQEARGEVGHDGLFWLWGGLSVGMGCIFFIMLAARVHRVLVHVSVLSVAIVIFLSTDGISMIRHDLSNGHQWLVDRERVAVEEVSAILKNKDYEFTGWKAIERMEQQYPWLPLAQVEKIKSIYDGLRQSEQAYSEHANRLFGRVAMVGADKTLMELPAFKWSRTQEQEAIQSEIGGFVPWVQFFGSWLLALLVGFFAIRMIRWKRLIENVPTSPIKGIMPGLSEIKADIELKDGTKPLVSRLKNRECVYYHYVEEEKRGSGKKERWVKIEDEELSVPFYANDDTGALLVDLDNAEIISRHKFSKTSGRRRYRETLISIDDHLYVIGDCQLNDDTQEHELVITKGDSSSPFIVSNYPESIVMLKKARVGMGLLTLSFAFFMGLLMVGFGMSGGFAFSDIVFAGLAAPLFGVFVISVLHYNDIIYLKQRVSRNWSNIDVLLQKRFDLYNSLQPVVQKTMEHEKELLVMLRQLRSESLPREGDAAALKHTLQQQGVVKDRLVALEEAYPDLKSNQVVSQFMATLSDMETEISLVRSGYNDAVETFNNRIQSFPDVLLAKAFKFDASDYGRW